MAIDSVCKKCRRAGQKLFLKGDRCLSPKCAFTRRSYAPGQAGQNPIRLTEYGKQLREKQKAAQIYGIKNTQFGNYYKKAASKKGETDLMLMRLLELRLDNIAYRLNFADSRSQARNMIKDGHITVNGKKVTSPSFQISLKDQVSIKKESQKKKIFENKLERIKKSKSPSWLKFDSKSLSGGISKLPERADIDTSIDEHIILEYFARQ